jgi:hypothetical protein
MLNPKLWPENTISPHVGSFGQATEEELVGLS